jgi:putative heme-binding domain-containing protein
MANIHEHAVLTDVLTREGSGFVASHGDDFLLANNAQWIGFSMEIGPAGDVYVLDWHDADICGKEVLNKETGRVYRISPKRSLAKNWKNRFADLATLPDTELAELQLSPSAWHARRARVILQHRATGGETDKIARRRLREIFRDERNADHRLRAMWALHVTGGLSEDDLLSALGHSDEYIRAWAIQLLTEDRAPSRATERFAEMAMTDASPVVRLYLAAALQRIPHGQRWEIAAALSRHAEDRDDHNIPKMLWFGIEPLVPLDPARALELAGQSAVPVLQEWTARRASQADSGALEALASTLGDDRQPPAALFAFLQGMRKGLEGRRNLKAPEGWQTAYERLSGSPDARVARLATELGQRFGDVGAEEAMLATLRNAAAPAEARRGALRQLAGGRNAELRRQLPALLDEASLRTEAIRATASWDDENFADLLLDRYPGYPSPDQAEVLSALAARPKSGWKLTLAIRDGRVAKKDVPAYVARQLRRVVGNGFVEVWGPLDVLPAAKEQSLAKYRALLTGKALAAADIAAGEAVFTKACSSCHQLYGEGGEIGPDLTGSNRGDLTYILDNMINPSSVIQDDYMLQIITTRDGRTFAGNIANENNRQVTIRMVGQESVIDKSTIQSRERVETSMMPEGLLDTLSDEEVINLVGYLRTMKE